MSNRLEHVIAALVAIAAWAALIYFGPWSWWEWLGWTVVYLVVLVGGGAIEAAIRRTPPPWR